MIDLKYLDKITNIQRKEIRIRRKNKLQRIRKREMVLMQRVSNPNQIQGLTWVEIMLSNKQVSIQTTNLLTQSQVLMKKKI